MNSLEVKLSVADLMTIVRANWGDMSAIEKAFEANATPIPEQGALSADALRAAMYYICLERLLNCHPDDRRHWKAAAKDALQNVKRHHS